jgi:hypothetical protein
MHFLSLSLFLAGAAFAGHTSKPFAGVRVNGGTATHAAKEGRHVLTLSEDFKVPDSPAPHWQVVDSSGNVFLLERLVIKGDKFHQTITVPAYVPDVAKVQIWCAWAEVLLGEAPFDEVQAIGASAKISPRPEGKDAPKSEGTTAMFAGAKANKGKATASHRGSDLVLTLSEDFVVPDTPAPHWQLVDSKGNVFLRESLKIKGEGNVDKGDKVKTSIVVPSFVHDVAKVQIWCAWAETLLGEASFEAPVR